MFRMLRAVGLCLLAALATPLFAESTPGPPDWADAAGSVYLSKTQQTPASNDSVVLQAPTAVDSSAIASAAAVPPSKVDSSVMPAHYHEPAAPSASADARRLAPPSKTMQDARAGGQDQRGHRTSSSLRPFVESLTPAGSLYTIFSALAIVIGAFLIFAWLLRRGGGKSKAPLPADVVSVLGRVPLAARQFAELLRVGNKLVLVSITPTGAETITEVTDPAEVDRLVGLCQQYSPHSTTKAFEQVFRQLSRESAPGSFLGSESLPQLSPAATAYRAHRGDTTRG
jgi:flagellar protein FliO/FliZ